VTTQSELLAHIRLHSGEEERSVSDASVEGESDGEDEGCGSGGKISCPRPGCVAVFPTQFLEPHVNVLPRLGVASIIGRKVLLPARRLY
jgi:hypothetical protein